MIAGLHACCRALEDERTAGVNVAAIVQQFVTTCEFDADVLEEVAQDDIFPDFVSLLLRCSYERDLDLASQIVQFLSTLASQHPTLYDIIAADTDLGDFAFHHFSQYTDVVDIKQVKATTIFPFIKFAAMIANSQHVNANDPQGIQTLISIATVLLEDPQLSAWASSIFAGLKRNSPVGEAHIRSLPNLLQIKRTLLGMRSSNDTCVACAALSTLVTMFLVKADSCSDLQMLVQFLSLDSQFFLMPILASDGILDLVKRTRLVKEDITSLLVAAMRAKGIRAVTIFRLLIQLTEYHGMIAHLVKQTQYLEELFRSLISHEESYVAPCGCQFLLQLSENDCQLLAGLNKSEIFGAALEALVMSSPQRLESLVVLVSMLTFDLKKSDVDALRQAEDFLFTAFLRAIEDNNSFLSLMLFRVLHKSARFIKGWSTHINRIVIDTQFPVLIANVLQESCERHVTRAALETMQYFTAKSEPEFSELFASAFLLLSKRRRDQRLTYDDQRRIERFQTQKTIEHLETINRQRESELDQMRTKNSQLVTAYNEELQRSKLQSEPAPTTDSGTPERVRVSLLKEETTKLQAKIAEQSAKITSQESVIDEINEENRILRQQIEDMKSEMEAREHKYQLIEERIQTEIDDKYKFALRNAESNAEEAQRVLLRLTEELEDAHRQCMSFVDEEKRTKAELAAIRESLLAQQEESEKMKRDLDLFEHENDQLRTSQRSLDSLKRKYAQKRAEMQENVLQAHKEGRQWESVARFDAIVRRGQLQTTLCAFDAISRTPK